MPNSRWANSPADSARSNSRRTLAQTILYEVSDGIGTITIARPAKPNAMTYAMLAEFLEIVSHAGQDEAARVLILTGSGGATAAWCPTPELEVSYCLG